MSKDGEQARDWLRLLVSDPRIGLLRLVLTVITGVGGAAISLWPGVEGWIRVIGALPVIVVFSWFLLDWVKNKKHQGRLSSDQLAARLHRRYPSTTFRITSSQADFYRLVAKKLIREIRRRLRSLESEVGPTRSRVRVGLVCGPMAFKTAEWIDRHRRFIKRDDFGKVVFVAMNKAAEADALKYSASSLAAFFSEVFQGSRSVAYTFNPYDKEVIDDSRRLVDILLCSVGSRNYKEQNYVDEWRAHMKNYSAEELTLPDNCVGDFCLTPIDADGGVTNAPVLLRLLKDHLDPYPRFTHVKHIKDSHHMTVIFPVSTYSRDSNRSKNEQGREITGKEMAAGAVLRSGAVDMCIVSRPLARNLDRAIGGYLLEKVSARHPGSEALRAAKAVSLEDSRRKNIAVYDPHGRIDQTYCTIDETMQPPLGSSEIPDIIISELVNEAVGFDWERGRGQFTFRIGGDSFSFLVGEGVRKPGQWALITSQMVRKYAERALVRCGGRTHLAVWDMGCGCGVIGILAGVQLGEKIGKILFSDIDSKAIECTKNNLANERGMPSYAVEQGSLFDVPGSDREFHVIAFNPPFLPMHRLSRATELDGGGNQGRDVAEAYCRGLRDHLAPDSWGILSIADYVDDGRFTTILEEQFGEGNVYVEDRIILYPFKTEPPIPPAYEIRHRSEIEETCDYRFEICSLGEREFLVFRMRHYLANRVNAQDQIRGNGSAL